MSTHLAERKTAPQRFKQSVQIVVTLNPSSTLRAPAHLLCPNAGSIQACQAEFKCRVPGSFEFPAVKGQIQRSRIRRHGQRFQDEGVCGLRQIDPITKVGTRDNSRRTDAEIKVMGRNLYIRGLDGP
jgi:hypothetical protein